MDYTPISASRMLLAFVLTVIVGIAPVLAIAFSANSSILGALSPSGGYGGLMLGLGSIAVAVTLIGLTWLAVAVGRRASERPSRA